MLCLPPAQSALTESDPVDPINLYALTKLQAEEACRFYSAQYGFPSVTLRLFAPYGPGDDERRLIPFAIRAFLKGQSFETTTGAQKWDFVFVDDIVDAFMDVLKAPSWTAQHHLFNIGAGQATSVRDALSCLKTLSKSPVEPSWGAMPHRKNELWFMQADIKKAEKALGWVLEHRC